MSRLSEELLQLAKDVYNTADSSAAERRRAVSACYYAVFHRLCEELQDDFQVSAFPEIQQELRQAIYRMPDHKDLKGNCQSVRQDMFNTELRDCAAKIFELQKHRHSADYEHPDVYQMPDLDLVIEAAERCILLLDGVDAQQRHEFVYFLTLKRR